MHFWQKYKNRIRENCTDHLVDPSSGLQFWSNHLFSIAITYLLPFSIIALIPGILFSIKSGAPILAAIDILIFMCMIAIATVTYISLEIRKTVFIACVYVLSFVLLSYLGASGPGTIYLYGASVFSILIFPTRNAYIWSTLNLIIVIIIAIMIYLGLSPSEAVIETHTVSYWIAVSSNLIFLSFLSSALLPKLFLGLQNTIIKQQELQNELKEEQKKIVLALDQLRQKNEELDQFASIASHDLKEPARMVNSFVQLLETRYGTQLDERANKYIRYAFDGSKRMIRLIDDLLEYARIGQNDVRMEQIDLNLLVNDVLRTSESQIELVQATIIVEQLPTLNGNRTALHLVFQNLLSNALKYQKPGVKPEVRISSTITDSYIISVSDNGIGISPEYRDKIFELFKRLHTQDEYPGTGLGLAICKKVIEQHQGSIWVESDSISGSTFKISLPKH